MTAFRNYLRHGATATVLAGALLLGACGGSEAGSEGDRIEPIEAPAGQPWTDQVTMTEEGGYLIGNPEAPIKLLEFGSLTCSHCRDFEAQAYDEIVDDFVSSGRVSFEFRNFMLNPFDLSLSLLTQCGGKDRFFPLTSEFYANQEQFLTEAQQVGEDKLKAAMAKPEGERFLALAETTGMIDFFTARGLPEDEARACLTDDAARKKLLSSVEMANEKYQVSSTPSIFIDGQRHDYQGWPALKTRLREMGAR